MKGLLILIAVAFLAALSGAEGDFPPPPMPRRPREFNIYCDVCATLMQRVQPYCEREEANLDYLPDFCVFNYNRVLRLECEFLVDVMEYAWCPSPCVEIRKLKAHSAPRICHHPLVNCTERTYNPSPSPSPAPSPSAPLPRDCILCELVLKNTAVMCMNQETANKKNIYRVCMERTWNKEDFQRCTRHLNELVTLAGTTDPCTMLSCENPQVACVLDANRDCHVGRYDGPPMEYSNLGLDDNGNFLNPDNSSAYHQTLGLGPGDFHPGEEPYHSPFPIHQYKLPPHVRVAGHLVSSDEPTEPVTPEEIAAAEAQQRERVEAERKRAKAEAAPTPVPLSEIKMQL